MKINGEWIELVNNGAQTFEKFDQKQVKTRHNVFLNIHVKLQYKLCLVDSCTVRVHPQAARMLLCVLSLQDNFLEVRALIDGHVIYSETILVPAQSLSSVQPSPSPGFEERKKDENLWFYYGLGIGGIFLSTMLALSLVLLMFFLQNKRRKDFKSKSNN